MKTLFYLLLAATAQAQVTNRPESGNVDAHLSTWRFPERTFSTLPAPSSNNIGWRYTVTDCLTTSCLSGGGTNVLDLRSDGAAWTPISGSGTGGGMNNLPILNDGGSLQGSATALQFKNSASVSWTFACVSGTCALTATSTGGAGAGSSSQLLDLTVVRTSSTVLTMTGSTNMRLNGVVYQIGSGATMTISSGSSPVYIYLNAAGILTAGSVSTVTCSGGCTYTSGVSAFPYGSIPIWTWTATSGTWDTSGGVDQRAVYSGGSPVAGSCLIGTQSGNTITFAVDPMCVGGVTSGTPDLSGGGSTTITRAVGCAKGSLTLSGGVFTLSPSGTTSAASTTQPLQEFTIITGLNGNMRYDHTLVSELAQFTTSGSVASATVSLGRTGGNNEELLPRFAIMQSSGEASFGYDRPQPPVLGSGSYSIVLAVRTNGANVSGLLAGSLKYEVCTYSIN